MPFETIEEGIQKWRESVIAEYTHHETQIYIPLSTQDSFGEKRIDLEAEVNHFIRRENSKQVCVLYGEGGSGKSLFLQQYTGKLWREYQPGQVIPLFVSLVASKNPFNNIIEEILLSAGFSLEQIFEIKKKYFFVLIFDGYDEIHQLNNCYVSNKLSTWNAKTIISCRSHYLSNKINPNIYFAPFKGEREQSHLLQILTIFPFNRAQIETYISQMQNRGVETPSYNQLVKIPGLEDMIGTPLLLTMAVEAWPEILLGDQSSTQKVLYSKLVTEWFLRQEKKLMASGHITEDMPDQKPIFNRYCQALALTMHQHNLSKLDAKDERLAVFFENDLQTAMIRSACPPWHPSIATYFRMSDNRRFKVHEKPKVTQVRHIIKESAPVGKTPTGNMHLCSIVNDVVVLRLFADIVKADSSFKKRLFDIIESSKENPEFALGAANAISILVFAKINFSGMDFKKIRVPGANLQGMIAYKTQFDHADLSGCNLKNAYLAEACFDGTNLLEVQWGEIPGFHWQSGSVTSLLFSQDGQCLIAGGDQNAVIIYDIKKAQEIVRRSLPSRVVHLDLSPDGQFLLISCDSGFIQLYHIASCKTRDIVRHGYQFHAVSTPTSAIFHPTRKEIIFQSEDELMSVTFSDLMQLSEIENFLYVDEKICITKFQWSNDGKILAVFYQKVMTWATSRMPRTIELWDEPEKNLVGSLEGYDFCLSSDGRLIVTMQLPSDGNDFLEVYDIPNLSCIKKLYLNQRTDYRIFARRGASICLKIQVNKSGETILVTGHDNGLILLWNLSSSATTPFASLTGHAAPISALAFSYDKYSDLLASSTGRLEIIGNTKYNRIRFWDMKLCPNNSNVDHYTLVRNMLMYPQQQQLISAHEDGSIVQWSTEDGAFYEIISGLLPESNICIFKSTVYFLNDAHQLQCYDLETCRSSFINLMGYQHFSDKVGQISLAISSDGTRVAIADRDEKTSVFSLKTNTLLFTCDEKGVTHISFSSDQASQFIYLLGVKFFIVINAHTGKILYKPWQCVERWVGDIARFGTLTLHPLHPQQVIISDDHMSQHKNVGDAVFLDIKEKLCLNIFSNQKSAIRCSEFSPDGNYLLIGYCNGEIIVWEMKTYKAVYTLKSHTEQMTVPVCLLFINEKEFVVSRSNGTLQAWKLKYENPTSISLELMWLHGNDLSLYDCSFYEAKISDSARGLIKVKSGKLDRDETTITRTTAVSASAQHGVFSSRVLPKQASENAKLTNGF